MSEDNKRWTVEELRNWLKQFPDESLIFAAGDAIAVKTNDRYECVTTADH